MTGEICIIRLHLRKSPSIKHISRSDQPRAGIKNLDRGLLIFVWTMAAFYGMMCEQMVGRSPAQSCEVRQPLDNIYGLVSLAFVLLTPASLGPLSAGLVYTVVRLVRTNLPTGSADWENIKCTASLTFIFLILYSNTMILCELWDFPQDNMFALVLSITAAVNSGKYLNYKIFPVKYVLGSSHNLLVPLAILLTKPEVWQMAKKVINS